MNNTLNFRTQKNILFLCFAEVGIFVVECPCLVARRHLPPPLPAAVGPTGNRAQPTGPSLQVRTFKN
jgi:hypothetical protein